MEGTRKRSEVSSEKWKTKNYERRSALVTAGFPSVEIPDCTVRN